jgi:hypothetical protein
MESMLVLGLESWNRAAQAVTLAPLSVGLYARHWSNKVG